MRLAAWWPTDLPVVAALHSYAAEIAVRALSDPSAQQEGTVMTATTSTQHPAPAGQELDLLRELVEAQGRYISELADRLGSQTRAIEALAGRVNIHGEYIDELLEKATALEAKVTALETAGPRSKGPDDTNDRIVGYLRDSIPGVWVTPGAIAINLDLDGKSVAGRLERLSHAGGLQGQRVERRGGRGTGCSPLYRVVPPPKPEQ